MRWNRVSEIKGKSVYEWYLNITVDTVHTIRTIDENGYIKGIDSNV